MTVINRTHNFIFVHIPKCGGTSITHSLSALTEYCDLEIGSTPYGESFQKIFSPRFGIFKHSFGHEIRAAVGRQTWASSFTFTFVRNPFKRAFSTYSYFKKHAFAYKFIESFETFNDYVESELWNETGPDRILLPQHHWAMDRLGHEIIVDRICKLENASQELDHVMRIIDPRNAKEAKVQLIHKNESTSGKAFPYLSDKSIDKILDRYRMDFELFDYEAAPLKSEESVGAQ